MNHSAANSKAGQAIAALVHLSEEESSLIEQRPRGWNVLPCQAFRGALHDAVLLIRQLPLCERQSEVNQFLVLLASPLKE